MTLMRKTASGIYIAHNATITGDVTVGMGCSFWFGSVVRGDVAPVKLGRRVNVQDNAVVHCDSGVENVIEDDVVIGHNATVHGTFVGEGTLIGMGATVLGQTRLGKRCLVAAGAVVPPGLVVPDGMLVMGVPGKIARPVTDKDLSYMRWLAGHYVEMAEKHVRGEVVDRAQSL